ncbi:MAG: carbonic anhydrase, partial [Candidatus Anammoxibacter sp.]
MESYEKLLLQNRAWAQDQLEMDKDFFNRMAKIQTPHFLWIGCSDSRVPATQITGAQPGEMFVHRNIANQVHYTDLNILSVLQYAVKVLKVKHVILCGHYGCGGIRAALGNQELGLLNNWLRNIKDIYQLHKTQLEEIKGAEERENMLVELNVKAQLMNLAKTCIIQQSWKADNIPHLHGWVYGLKDGLINDIMNIAPRTSLESIYEYEL